MFLKKITLCLSIVLVGSAFRSDVRTDQYTGYAYEEESKDLIYTEEFTDKFIDGKHTETLTQYFDPAHKQIAHRKLKFSERKFAPDFKTEDLRTGYIEGAEVVDGKVKLFYRKDKNSQMKSKTIAVPEPMVIDGGFNQYIKSNWEQLLDGKVLTFYFTVSSRLDYFKMRASKMSIKDEKMKVKIEPDKALIRWIADPIIVVYNTETKRIISYEGKSNIADEHGENFDTKLVYPKKGP